MTTNKNVQLRYQILDRCFSDFRHKYTIDELIDKVNDRLASNSEHFTRLVPQIEALTKDGLHLERF